MKTQSKIWGSNIPISNVIGQKARLCLSSITWFCETNTLRNKRLHWRLCFVFDMCLKASVSCVTSLVWSLWTVVKRKRAAWSRTYLHDSAEHWGVVHCAAVPAALAKLVLALLDARLGTLSNELHVILVQLAKLPLTFGQSFQLTAQRLTSYDIRLWYQEGVHC